MSIKTILKNAEKVNIADGLDKEKLTEIADWVCTGHSDDMETMKDWAKMIKDGMDIAKPELKASDRPWENASNYKSPLIGEAVRNFGDRANSELLRGKDLAAVDIITAKTPETEALSDRVTKHVNYQLNHEIPGWRTQQGRALYGLAATGARIKKVFYDSTIGGVNSEWICYPNFSLNNNCNDFNELDRFTHIRKYTDNDIFTKKRSKEWLNTEFECDDEDKKDNYYTFLECYCLYDIDEDDYAEPYIITVHEASKTVVRIVARYAAEDVYCNYNDKVVSAAKVESELKSEYEQNELMTEPEQEELSIKEISKELSKAKLVRIDATQMLTLYNFIIPIDDTLLGNGFLHIMSSSVKGINKASNALFNAGDLANVQGGFLSKEHRGKGKGPVSTSPGKFIQTDVPASALQSSIMLNPVKEPSPSFMQINEILKAEVQDISTKVNIQDALSPNIPAASVLGMLQEGVIPTTALMTRIINAMSSEFEIIAGLNAQYTDPMLYDKVTGVQGSDAAADYESEDIIIKPTANAEFSSQSQRMQLAQVEMQFMPNVQQVGGNAAAIVRNFYKAIGSNVEEYFPEEGKMPDADQKMNEQMMALQKQQQDIQQQQNQLYSEQLALAKQSQDLKQLEAEHKAGLANKEFDLKMNKAAQEIKNMIADMTLTYEKAESEQVKNQIDIYTAKLATIERMYDTGNREVN